MLDHAGQLGAAFDAAKGAASPNAARDELEGTGADFLARTGHPDDDAFAPAFVAALQRGTHDLHIAYALKAEFNTAVGHLDNDLLNRLVKFAGVDAIRRAHDAGQIKLAGVGVYADDAPCTSYARALNHRQTDAAQTENRHGVARLYFGGVTDRAQASGDAAAQQADLLRISCGVDFGEGDFGHHGVFAEGAGTHVMKQRLALVT